MKFKMPYNTQTASSAQEDNRVENVAKSAPQNLNLPTELWALVSTSLQSYDCAVVSKCIGVSSHPLVAAMMSRAADEYKYPCPATRKVYAVPCGCKASMRSTVGHLVVKKDETGSFICCAYNGTRSCRCRSDSMSWVTIQDREEALRQDLLATYARQTRGRYGPDPTESEMEEKDREDRDLADWRDYLRHCADNVVLEEDLCLKALFFSRELVVLGPKGADEPGSDPVPPPPSGPVLDRETVGDDTVPDQVTGPGLPIAAPTPINPGDEAAAEQENSGNKYENVLSNERSGQPVEEPEHAGWLSWLNDEDETMFDRYAGTIMRSARHKAWEPALQGHWNSVFTIGGDIMRDVKAHHKTVAMSVSPHVTWGYGEGTPDATITKAGYIDTYEVVQCTTDRRTVMIPFARDTIAYNVPFGMSVYNRAQPFNSTASVTPLSDILSAVEDKALTSAYNSLILTSSSKGNNHIALGCTMYMRLMALEMLAEQGAATYIDLTAEGFNRFLLPVEDGDDAPIHKVARSVVARQPYNMITLPDQSADSDAILMYYLAGNSRITTYVTAGPGAPDLAVHSTIDLYVPEQCFTLCPLNGSELIEKRDSDDDGAFKVDAYRARSLVSRYLTAHNLWQQFPVMRAFAWALLAHPATSVNMQYPAPMHTADLQLNLFPNPASIEHRGVILGERDHQTSLHASVVTAARMAEEVLTDSIVSTVVEAGIEYTNPAYTGTVEQELGRHLYHGYAHLIMPIVEKLLGDTFPELTQYLADSVLALEHCTTGRDLDRKKFRASSYLCMEETPEGEGWQVVFSESRRKQILQQEYCTEREQLTCLWLTQKVAQENVGAVTYYQHEILPSESVSDTPVVRGWLGKNRLDYLRGAPILWGTSTTAVAYKHSPQRVKEFQLESNELGPPTGLFAQLYEKRMQVNSEAMIREDEEALGTASHREEKGWAPKPEPKREEKKEEVVRVRPTATKKTKPVRQQVPVLTVKAVPSPDKEGFLPVTGGARPTSVQVTRMTTMPMGKSPMKVANSTPKVRRTLSGGYKKPTPWHLRASSREEEEAALKQSAEARKSFESRPLSLGRLRILLEKEQTSAEDRKEIDRYYDRGMDAALKRAPYTAGVMWSKRQIIAKNKTRIAHLKTAMLNGAYGKNAWMVTLGLWIMTNTMTDNCFEDLIKEGILKTEYSDWNSKWASYNDIIRNKWAKGEFQHTPDDLVQCLYIANMVGRPHRECDWDDEVKKRTRNVGEIKIARNGKMVPADESQLEEEILQMLLKEGSIRVKKPKTFEQFYSSRGNWMIKGSASGERMLISEYKEIVGQVKGLGVELRERATKTDVAEYVSAQAVLALLDDMAIHLAKAHTKGNEHGKVRAIYGSLYAHYVLGSFWSTYLEDTVTLASASMNKDNSRLIAETMQRAISCRLGRWIVCLDYADFNAQHSGMAQRSVIRTLYKWAKMMGFQPTEEFNRISEWYADSFTNQWFQRPDNKQWVRAVSGMFSGVRQTTLINTILNLTYHHIAMKNCYNLGQKVECLQTYVLGDDGWVEFSTKEEAEMYVVAARMGGMEINAIKQLIGQGKGEYLRLIYDVDGRVRGCPVRSLASFVHGNVESKQASVGQQRITEMYSQACMLVRRGLDPARWQKVFEDLAIYEIGYTTQVSRGQCLKYLYGSKRSGGLGLMPLNTATDRVAKLPVEAEEAAEEVDVAQILADSLVEGRVANKFKASSDYVGTLEREYGVVWKHNGKIKATAQVAASNLVEGITNVGAEHEVLKMRVLGAQLEKAKWLEAMNWDRWNNGPLIGPENIEKQYRKIRVSEDKLLSTVTKVAKLAHLMSAESVEAVQMKIAADLDVSVTAVKHSFKSASVLRGEQIDYIPKPVMAPELEGIYTQWLTVNNNDSQQMSIPRWIADYTAVLRY
ncbi:cap-pol fusion protein [Sclerotinia sclerotiorum botybirnavirus 3]|nr:cap-pol fusion protein [Sclerotinia sclerotiorum botybirnavirus 3]